MLSTYFLCRPDAVLRRGETFPPLSLCYPPSSFAINLNKRLKGTRRLIQYG